MSKREHITIIKTWQVTAGEHTGKWFAGVQWTEGVDQRYRHIDCPRSTFHEAQRDAAEQQISDAIEALHDHGVPVDGGMVASVTTLAKAWRLLSETHNATIQEAMEARDKAERERDEALELKEVWRAERRNLEANLDMARKNLSAACEQREQAKRERDEMLGMKRTDSAVIESLGHECEDLRAKVAEQARAIAALHQALGDAYGLPDA